MTKEMLSKANILNEQIGYLKSHLNNVKRGKLKIGVDKFAFSNDITKYIGESRMNHIRYEVISGLQEQLDNCQAEFDALGNGGETDER